MRKPHPRPGFSHDHDSANLDEPAAGTASIARVGKESSSAAPPPVEPDKKATDQEKGDRASVVQVSLAEFGKLRDEISGRSTSAWTLLGLNATVSSAVAGFVLGKQADPMLLLLLPLLTPSLGLLVIDHATNIGNIGQYINTVLKPLLQEATGEKRLLCYEEWVDRYEEQPIRRLLPFGIPLVLLFNVVPLASLIYTAARIPNSWMWVLWALGVVMTAVQVGFWCAFLLPPLRRALTDPK
jgi:hypothetical protein